MRFLYEFPLSWIDKFFFLRTSFVSVLYLSVFMVGLQASSKHKDTESTRIQKYSARAEGTTGESVYGAGQQRLSYRESMVLLQGILRTVPELDRGKGGGGKGLNDAGRKGGDGWVRGPWTGMSPSASHAQRQPSGTRGRWKAERERERGGEGGGERHGHMDGAPAACAVGCSAIWCCAMLCDVRGVTGNAYPHEAAHRHW